MSKEELEWYEHYMRQDKEELVDMIMTRNGNIKNYKKQIKELKQELKEWSLMFDTFSKREYAHKYLEERRKENPNIIGLDSDEIYREYYKLRDRIDKAIEYINDMCLCSSGYFDYGDDLSPKHIVEILRGGNNE